MILFITLDDDNGARLIDAVCGEIPVEVVHIFYEVGGLLSYLSKPQKER